MKRCTYLLPIRRASFSESEASKLSEYFARLQKADCEVLVIGRDWVAGDRSRPGWRESPESKNNWHPEGSEGSLNVWEAGCAVMACEVLRFAQNDSRAREPRRHLS